jgi:hypothetical protein
MCITILYWYLLLYIVDKFLIFLNIHAPHVILMVWRLINALKV